MIRLLVILVLATGLAACKTTLESPTPKTTVEAGDYKVTFEDDSRDSGTFCPPGQAKKGRC